ncbi:DUF3180 family protein [Curtobacterium flaccumfaciens]|nr:DUF3180 family protein [Curtobacterium flaccumfaciens]
MKPTRASTLISVAVVAAVAGFALDAVLASRQVPTLFLATPLGITLAFIGVAVVLMARPIRRHARDGAARQRPVDPLYATRVVVLAKASSICGSLFGGFGLGLLVYLLTRSALPSLGSTMPNAVAVGVGSCSRCAHSSPSGCASCLRATMTTTSPGRHDAGALIHAHRSTRTDPGAPIHPGAPTRPQEARDAA